MKGYKKKTGMLYVDSNKFKEQFISRGIDMADANYKLGRSKGYLQAVCGGSSRAGKISKSTTIMLENLYGIKYEDYASSNSNTGRHSESEEKVSSIDYDRLYDVIYKAVFDAFDHIFNGKENEKKEGGKEDADR